MRKSLHISSTNLYRLTLPIRLLSTSIRHLTLPGAHLNKKAKPLPPLAAVPEKDLIETFLKGSGPGGQKIVVILPPTVPSYHAELSLNPEQDRLCRTANAHPNWHCLEIAGDALEISEPEDLSSTVGGAAGVVGERG